MNLGIIKWIIVGILIVWLAVTNIQDHYENDGWSEIKLSSGCGRWTAYSYYDYDNIKYCELEECMPLNDTEENTEVQVCYCPENNKTGVLICVRRIYYQDYEWEEPWLENYGGK